MNEVKKVKENTPREHGVIILAAVDGMGKSKLMRAMKFKAAHMDFKYVAIHMYINYVCMYVCMYVMYVHMCVCMYVCTVRKTYIVGWTSVHLIRQP